MFEPQGPSFVELCQQALSSTERGYDLLAEKFDHTPFRTPQEVVDQVLGLLPGLPVAAGLDLCCGTGAGVLGLQRVCTQRVLGLDMSEGMLSVAARNTRGLGGPTVELERADIMARSFQPRFDLVTCWGAFGHIPEEDEGRFLDQVVSALAPGGRCVFVTADVPSNWSWQTWVLRGFNGVMRVRNALLDPPFIMYYLTFHTSRAKEMMQARGLEVQVLRGVIPAPWSRMEVIIGQAP